MKLNKNNLDYRILVIDDNAEIHQDFSKILMKTHTPGNDLQEMESALFGSETPAMSSGNFEIDCASQGREGLDLAKKANLEGRPYAMAFVDGRMPPGWDGIETISHLWQECPDLQAVLCTAYADYSWQEIRRVLGETDAFLILKKPFDNMEVLQLAHALTCKWALNRDIQGRLNQLAFYDSLTGLPNRTMFIDRLTQELDRALRYEHKLALLYIDLDNFKRINDTLGHNIGDDLLKVTSERLSKCLRISDTVAGASLAEIAARLGGDEFTVILPDLSRVEYAGVVAQRIGKQLSRPMYLGGNQVVVTPSIGIAIFPQDGDNMETLLKNADVAMYSSKRKGPNMFRFYQETMNCEALKRMTIENHLRKAFELDEFKLQYQPQFDLFTGQTTCMAAELCWQDRKLGDIPPDEFLPIAEENGYVVVIDDWVLRTACEQAKTWFDQGLPVERVAVRVSVNQLSHPNFLEVVRNVLDETILEPRRLEIQITEHLLANEVEGLIKILDVLHKMNIRIAIDNFGTGYSSLSCLKEMPIDYLKIDRSFVSGISDSSKDQSIICAIITMAEGLNLRLIAKGVETKRQIDFLREKKCHEAQGNFFSRPLSFQEAEAFMRQPVSSK